MINLIKNELSSAQKTLDDFLNQPEQLANIETAVELMVESFKQEGKVMSCGNGGSHCDAMHFAEELSGKFREARPAIAAMALSDISHTTCVGNDYGFDFIFSRALEALGRKGDVLLAISTSGNSKNILEACKAAKAKGLKIIALTGKDGGKLAKECDVEIRVPHNGYADRIQEIHIKIIHIFILLIEKRLGYAS
ncbi:phosphoheptose isomerase [Marivirga tractuosa]|uniref:Phosphoheptose isomerase n=1 Tax=Marivirga tractuosa (strain ATCC 23168 / DSM 4126 / NBRC 15989 / NCIMB 1408 / VKM B-1430 / H-43) TaxID=643867 RepID=E4TPN7_MARTH|nr:D-sedoheptulose 7-phosphate isomerase [Marivirga tractuosa]ADR22601.1 phosphoheptose isomerase [Marivirga tractuosa DSM 4126]BDD16728.1 phosphoheptose isomerase [Marivirga tractuosa]